MNIPKNWLTENEYELVTKKVPIHCVDLVIFRNIHGILETLLLVRKTGYEKGKYCIIGGRQRKDETVKETINRQAKDLGLEVSIISPFTYDFPVWVNSKLDQDKTKQSVCSIYPVQIANGEILKSGKEYSDYKWFPIDKLPDAMAYDHGFEVSTSVKQLKKFNRKYPELL